MAIKKEDIKELTNEELVEKIKDERTRLQKLRFNHTVSSLDNPLVLRSIRRDVARLITELHRRQTAPAEEIAEENN